MHGLPSTPAEWLDAHLVRHQTRFLGGSAGQSGSWMSRDDLLRDDAMGLRASFDRLVTEHSCPQLAATFVVAWLGGSVADALGFALATTHAGFLPDPVTVRWFMRPEGWPERVDFAPDAVVVAAEHPWAGHDGVQVVDDIAVATVERLVAIVGPLVDACRGFTKVGAAGLWNQVGDALGLSVSNETVVPVTDEVLRVLDGAVRSSPRRWRALPRLRIVQHPTVGPVFMGQKGGCCLAYRSSQTPGQRQYCATCSLLDPSECERRQLSWLDHES